MATQPTLAAAKTGLVARFATALTSARQDGGQVQVAYAWPGPNTEPESVFFGRHPLSAVASETSTDYEIRSIKAGRKHRDEDYDVDLTIWVFRPDLTALGAETVETQAYAHLGLVSDVLADDPKAGLNLSWVFETRAVVSRLIPMQTDPGWVCDLTLTINAKSRLT